MSYQISWESDCVTINWEGKISLEENIEANGVIYGDKRFDQIKYQVSNLLNANLSEMLIKNIKVVGELDKQSAIWNKRLQVVHIATDSHTLKLIDYWEQLMHGSGWSFKTFSTINEAEKWVNGLRRSN
ncbi:MAG: hypothetical protein CL663_05000 [Bacteroidetes bacterium]|nr:hypothetical protein [Bacteroidota bacterium]|tara:strand:+ start:387 stop:770 length:384 start_codon:yes stop_codon:yes gene_type:complete